MTTYGAYDRGLPCKNPNCASHGKPHPNCRCYPNLLAEGGEVKFRCEGPHQSDCQYFRATPVDVEEDHAAAFAHLGLHGMLGDIDTERHARATEAGHNAIRRHVEALFDRSKDMPGHKPDLKRREKIHKFLEAGGIAQSLKEASYPKEPQAFAHGGEVKPAIREEETLGADLPVQNVMLNAAKAQAANYLNALRPQKNALKLPFDAEPSTKSQERRYHRAIDVANDPLSVLGKIRDGSLGADHVTHLHALSPELTNVLKKRITERILKAQIDEEKPSRIVRQGLSAFMGTPLSHNLTPQGIQAVQATFSNAPMPQQQPGKPPGKTKHSPSTLSKSDQAFLTSSQAREAREQRS